MQELDSQRGEGAYFRGNTVHVPRALISLHHACKHPSIMQHDSPQYDSNNYWVLATERVSAEKYTKQHIHVYMYM